MRRARPLGGFLVLATLSACVTASPEHASGRLAARPHAPSRGCPSGLHRLGVDPAREALLYVPESAASAASPVPLVVYLHGASGQASRGIERLRALADARGVVVLAPQSLDFSWDAIHGSLGPDVERIDHALALAFDRCAVDPERISVAGFSDGASYALSLGLANGELFRRVVAFSPCLIARGIALSGKPSVFVSAGRADEVLPVAHCGRPLVMGLQRAGYSVTYKEFDGRHEVPVGVAEAAFAWLFGPASSR